MEVKYYVCSHCGNIIEMVKDEGVPIMCCDTVMKGLRPGMTDASAEKHVPVCTVQGEHVHVVGRCGTTSDGERTLHRVDHPCHGSGHLQKETCTRRRPGGRFLPCRWRESEGGLRLLQPACTVDERGIVDTRS